MQTSELEDFLALQPPRYTATQPLLDVGTFCLAWLDSGSLCWADGDVWQRPEGSMLESVTRSLEPFALCLLLRSLADARDFSASILENRRRELERLAAFSQVSTDCFVEVQTLNANWVWGLEGDHEWMRLGPEP